MQNVTDANSAPLRASLLRCARISYPEFYNCGTSDDIEVMDGLVLAHALMGDHSETVGEGGGGAAVSPQATSAAHLYAATQEQIRASDTFQALNPTQRAHIETMLFGADLWRRESD